MNINLITVFWGEWHEDCFLQFSLPSLLKEFNIYYLCQHAKVKFKIRSTPRFIVRAQNDINFRELKELIEVEIEPIILELDEDGGEAQFDVSKYTKWSYLLSKLISESLNEGSGIIFIAPDAVYSSNTLKSVWQNIVNKKKILWMAHVRCCSESFSKEWLKFSEEEKSDDILIKTTLDNLHDYSKSQIWGKFPMNCRLNSLFFKGKSGTLFSKMFDSYPIYVDTAYADFKIKGAVDTDFDKNVFQKVIENKGFGALGVMTDMREGFLASMVPKEDLWIHDVIKGDVDILPPLPPNSVDDLYSANWRRLIYWTAFNTNSKQRYQFTNTFFFGNPYETLEIHELNMFTNLTLSFAQYYQNTYSLPSITIEFDSPINCKLKIR